MTPVSSPTLLIAIAALTATPAVLADDLSFGLGLGTPYGGSLGTNLSYQLHDHIDTLAALGLNQDGAGWEVGARVYPSTAFSNHRDWRLTVLYGTNTVQEISTCNGYYCKSDYESFNGLTLGIGWGTRAGYQGWGIDLLYITSSAADDRIDELQNRGYYLDDTPRIDLSSGYQWDF
ncbi:hypothetical protein [Oceanobacter sp. 4_MG-2023]|uniref:hypothetical protein n=1 Tax=Oceanobacter sp. 4_MG-2023 TaxID=3062623 RepID=UPI0027349DF9|nr:hypothetical protein [Oceanobacter sp. 4_MG-2023]MDP2549003.1 hypothetical protein [Oceanobacter sp. 4_MG-2023]